MIIEVPYHKEYFCNEMLPITIALHVTMSPKQGNRRHMCSAVNCEVVKNRVSSASYLGKTQVL